MQETGLGCAYTGAYIAALVAAGCASPLRTEPLGLGYCFNDTWKWKERSASLEGLSHEFFFLTIAPYNGC